MRNTILGNDLNGIPVWPNLWIEWREIQKKRLPLSLLFYLCHSCISMKSIMQYDDLSMDIINLWKQTVFQELQGTDNAKGKYVCLFSKSNGGCWVKYPSNILRNTRTFPSFSWVYSVTYDAFRPIAWERQYFDELHTRLFFTILLSVYWVENSKSRVKVNNYIMCFWQTNETSGKLLNYLNSL